MFLKPRHILQGLVVTPWDFVGGWRHLLSAWRLRLGLAGPDAHLSRFHRRGIEATVKVNGKGEMVCCHFCGNAIVEFELAQGWNAEMCSAAISEKHFSGKHFESWKALLSHENVKSGRQPERETAPSATNCKST